MKFHQHCKSFFLATILTLANTNAMATWTNVSENALMEVFADKNSIKHVNGITNITTIKNSKPNSPLPFFSVKMEYEVNCKVGLMRIISAAYYNKRNATGGINQELATPSNPNSWGQWERTFPNTHESAIMEFACAP